MKAKLYLIILVFTCLTLNAQTTYTWDYVSSLQNEWLQKICTQGLDTVFVAGNNGLIARSTDRALTWTKQYPVNTRLNDIIFCNHTIGFAVGNNGVILRTTDAGANVTTTKPSGPVTILPGANLTMNVDGQMVINDSFEVQSGSQFEVK